MSNCLFILPLILLTLTGCDTADFTITKTEVVNGKCTFTVSFPENYRGYERGTQVFTVAPYIAVKETSLAWKYTLEGQSDGIGPDLRRRCGGLLLEPALPVKQKAGL